MSEDRLVETAALVALLRRPGARWSDVAAEALAEGRATSVLRRAMYAVASLFDDGDAMQVALDAALVEVRGWLADGISVHCVFHRASALSAAVPSTHGSSAAISAASTARRQRAARPISSFRSHTRSRVASTPTT